MDNDKLAYVFEKLQTDQSMLARVLHVLEVTANMEQKPLVEPEDVLRMLGPRVFGLDHEVVFVIGLDAFARPISLKEAIGTSSSVAVHVRDILRHLLTTPGVVSWILAHNHPSGQDELKPSELDEDLTQKFLLASRMVQVPLLDHLILDHAGERLFSFKKSWAPWVEWGGTIDT